LIEPLEEKALLSHMLPHVHHRGAVTAAVSGTSASRAVPTLSIQGRATGSYTVTSSSPTPGANYNLSGAGTLGTVGSVQVSGVIHLGFNRIKSQPAGVLTITGSHGSLRLSMQTVGGLEPMAAGSSSVNVSNIPTGIIPSSIALKFTIVNGTGAYRGVHGSGTASLGLFPNQPVKPPILSRIGALWAAPPPPLPGSGPLPPVTISAGGGTSGGGGGSRPLPVGVPTFLAGQFRLDFLSSHITPKRSR